MLDWLQYIIYTGADERENQPVQNRTTGRHLRQGGSSWTTAPAAAVPAQRTGTQPGTPQLRSPWSNISPAVHPGVCWKIGKEQRHPHQPNLQGRTAQALSNDGSRSNGWQDTIDKIFQKPTGITTKFFLQIVATDFV